MTNRIVFFEINKQTYLERISFFNFDVGCMNKTLLFYLLLMGKESLYKTIRYLMKLTKERRVSGE